MNDKNLRDTLKRWDTFYKERGVDVNHIQRCMCYVKNLLENQLPVIFDLEHLSLLLSLEKEYLLSIVYGPESHYRTFTIKKKSGGERTLTVPHYTLKYVQRWIYVNILANVPINRCAHGFCKGHSIVTNAKQHCNQDCLLKLDLKDFFPSIHKNFVIQVFHKLGYAPKISFYLASICCYNDSLPQGAPTSPALSNIIACHLDNRLFALAKKMGYRYTRYADDIAFSGKDIPVAFIKYVENIIVDCQFELNKSKIRLYKKENSKLLTGVSLNTGQLHLPRDYRRNLKKELYYIQKYGFNAHVQKLKIRRPNYLLSMIGKVDYWLMVEPDNLFAQKAKKNLKEVYRNLCNK